MSSVTTDDGSSVVTYRLPFAYSEEIPVETELPGYADTMTEAERISRWVKAYRLWGITDDVTKQQLYTQVHIDFIKNGTSPYRDLTSVTVTVGGQPFSLSPIHTVVYPEFRKFADAEFTYHRIMRRWKEIPSYGELLMEQMNKFGTDNRDFGTVCFDYSTRVRGLHPNVMDFAKQVASYRISSSNISKSSGSDVHTTPPTVPKPIHQVRTPAFSGGAAINDGY